VLPLQGFADGPLIPALGYLVSSVGVFLGLRCGSRARACPGPARTRWPALAGVAVGGLGIWAAVALSPTEDAINYDAALLAHIRRRTENPVDPRAATPAPAPLAGPASAPFAVLPPAAPPPAAPLPAAPRRSRNSAAGAPAEPGPWPGPR